MNGNWKHGSVLHVSGQCYAVILLFALAKRCLCTVFKLLNLSSFYERQ